jgi:hypothetical protein
LLFRWRGLLNRLSNLSNCLILSSFCIFKIKIIIFKWNLTIKFRKVLSPFHLVGKFSHEKHKYEPDTCDFRQGRNTDHRDHRERMCMWVLCCSTPHVLRVGAYIGIISRHMTVGPFQSLPSRRQLWRLMSCMCLNITSCMTIDDIKCHDKTLKTLCFETGPSKQEFWG